MACDDGGNEHDKLTIEKDADADADADANGNEHDDATAEKNVDADYIEDDQVHPRHVLVCAPSNAALDEIIFRILESGR